MTNILDAIKEKRRRIISSRSKVVEMTPEEKAEMIKIFEKKAFKNPQIRKIVNKNKVYYAAVEVGSTHCYTKCRPGNDRREGDYGSQLVDEFSLKEKCVCFMVMHNGEILDNLMCFNTKIKFVGTYGYSRDDNAYIDTRNSENPGTPYRPEPCLENSFRFSGRGGVSESMSAGINISDINAIRNAVPKDVAYFLDKFFIVTPEERKKYNEFAKAADLRREQGLKGSRDELEFRAGFWCENIRD